MKNEKKTNLAFFLELGGTLETWSEVGFFSREIALYNILAKEYCNQIFIFTYGNHKDKAFQKFLAPNITIIPWGDTASHNYFINFIYEIILPFRFWKIIKQCDLLKTNQNSGSLGATLAKILFSKKKLIVRCGYLGSELEKKQPSFLLHWYYFLVENLSYRFCDISLCPDNIADIISTKYNLSKEKIVKLNNFIDTSLFKKDSSVEKKYDIIYVGRFHSGKNHLALIKYLATLPLKILFIGSGDTETAVKEAAKNTSLTIEIIPSVKNEELPFFYNSATLYAFPSLYEGNPKTLLEAMACELPVFALASPGVTNIISHNKNGLLIEEQSFKETVNHLLKNPDFCAKLSHEARRTILNNYNLESISQKEIALYKKILCL